MAELKRIDEAKNENKKIQDVQFEDFPLEQFSDASKVANEGDPHLKPQENPNTGDTDYNGGQRGRGRRHDRGTRGRGNGGNSNNRYDHPERGAGCSQGQRDFHYNRGHGQDNSYRG